MSGGECESFRQHLHHLLFVCRSQQPALRLDERSEVTLEHLGMFARPIAPHKSANPLRSRRAEQRLRQTRLTSPARCANTEVGGFSMVAAYCLFSFMASSRCGASPTTLISQSLSGCKPLRSRICFSVSV